MRGLLQALARRDRGWAALRRAGRTAIVMPAMFALGAKVLDNPELATFAAFGSFALLLLVDFGGPLRDRLLAQTWLAITGAVFICIATLASRQAWLAATAMTLVGLAVLFAGVVSSVLAGATTSLCLAFILPVSLAGPPSSIPDRLAGWGLAAVASLLAIGLLWPAPSQDPLRAAAGQACAAIAGRLRFDADRDADRHADCGVDGPTASSAAADAAAQLHRVFLQTPFRPTGLSTVTRGIVRLVDELDWLHAILEQDLTQAPAAPADRHTCQVKLHAAAVLDEAAVLLGTSRGNPGSLRSALAELRRSLLELEDAATARLPGAADPAGVAADLVSALDPGFRAQELSFAVSLIGANVDLIAAAERRGWLDQLLGRQPAGFTGAVSSARQRAAAHLEPHSVWLHNSVRGALGLGAAVLIANLTGVQHSFWVVLGTLSVLRSSALNTGQNVLRAVLGTAVGFAIGAVLLIPIGTNTTVLWLLLPVAILIAGVAPAAISFAAGQAGFTLTLVILFNIIQPAGWRVGLVRVEDIALGCSVSLVIGLICWPRGAAAALGKALAEAYSASAQYLGAAVQFGMARCDAGVARRPAPVADAQSAAAAARRLDDAFRSYLAERGAKGVPLAEVSSLVTGVAGLRLAADAVLELWQRDDGGSGGDRSTARGELTAMTAAVQAWYDRLATSLARGVALPEPPVLDEANQARLLATVRQDLSGPDGRAGATAVRMVWTADHLDAARRLQGALVQPVYATQHVLDPGKQDGRSDSAMPTRR